MRIIKIENANTNAGNILIRSEIHDLFFKPFSTGNLLVCGNLSILLTYLLYSLCTFVTTQKRTPHKEGFSKLDLIQIRDHSLIRITRS